jgi:hypothetical protein
MCLQVRSRFADPSSGREDFDQHITQTQTTTHNIENDYAVQSVPRLQVRSRFADGSSGKEDFRPLLAALKALGFKLVQQDAANRMFVVWVMQKKADGAKLGVASGIKWPTLRACMYKKR